MSTNILPNRRSIRLKGYDYSQAGLYFLTLSVHKKRKIFGEIIDGEMRLNSLGEIAKEEWEKTEKIRKNISLGEFIIMQDHMHGIISIDFKIKIKNKEEELGKFKSPSQTSGAIIRGYKGATTKRINNLIRESGAFLGTGELQFAPTQTAEKLKQEFNLKGEGSIWQRDYYERIIKTERALKNISNYIIMNPRNWAKKNE